MFSCCSRKKIVPKKMSPPIATPTSPPFTSDEIVKIQANLTNICDFNFYAYLIWIYTK